MSTLKKMLNDVLVEWKALEEIGELYNGLTGKKKDDFEEGNAKFVSYKNIYGHIEVNPDILESVKISPEERQNEVKYGDVLFTGSSENTSDVGISCAVTFQSDFKLYLNSFSFGLRFRSNFKLLPEFTKYLFRSQLIREQIIKTANGVTRYNVSKKRFLKLQIPIPYPNDPQKSLEIQQEIVRVLDGLSDQNKALTTALVQEIEQRKKQYEYYREELFRFEGKVVEWKKIREIGTFQRGKRFVRIDMISEGVPCIHYGEMYTHYGVWAKEAKSFLSEELVLSKKLRVAEKNDVVIVAAGETIEDIGKGTAWLGEDGVVIHDACFSYKSSLNPVYFAYFTRTILFHDQIRRNISSGKISAINEKGFNKVIIPVPSTEEQERIVCLLDQFDEATNNIVTALKNEIELRNKQYEYYRNLLLNFPKENK